MIDYFIRTYRKSKLLAQSISLIECDHMPVPMPAGSCAICNGTTDLRLLQNREYHWHEAEVVLEPLKGMFKWTEAEFAVWTPTAGDCPQGAKVIHISGNWKFSDLMKACAIKSVMAIEFAPSQKFMLSRKVTKTAENYGIGIWLRSLRGPKS